LNKNIRPDIDIRRQRSRLSRERPCQRPIGSLCFPLYKS